MYTIRDMPEPVPAELLTLLAGVETATVGHWRLQGSCTARSSRCCPAVAASWERR